MIKTYPEETWTYGSELEIADWNTKLGVPPGHVMDTKDYTIANTCGIGNDPKKKDNIYGGEVQVKVTDSIEKAVEACLEVYDWVAPYSINHTCNFHIHIGVPGLIDDLRVLKQMSKWVYENQEEVYKLLPPVPKIADLKENLSAEHKHLYIKRSQRRSISHRAKMSQIIYLQTQEATDPVDWKNAHYPKKKDGKPNFLGGVRKGINTIQLFETGTIEFRFFQGTDNPDHLLSAFLWCKEILKMMLGEIKDTPEEAWWRLKEDYEEFELAPFVEVDCERERIFKMTKFDAHNNGRQKVRDRIKQLVLDGIVEPECFLDKKAAFKYRQELKMDLLEDSEDIDELLGL